MPILCLIRLLHNEAHAAHPCVCLLLSIQTGRNLRVGHVLLGYLVDAHVRLLRVVVSACARADLGRLRLARLQILRLAAIDTTIVGAVRNQGTLVVVPRMTQRSLDVVQSAWFHTSVPLVAGDTIGNLAVAHWHKRT